MSSRYERLLRLTERTIARGVKNRSGQIRVEDERLEGPFITVDGNRLVDFGSCAYLGLNRHPELARGASDALSRFGTAHSSSPMYTAVGLYTDLEDRLEHIFDAPVAVAPTTTLAHLAALPVLVDSEDLLLLDQFSHASLQLASDVLRGRGVEVDILPHNDVAALKDRLHQDGARYRRVWYCADGVYSMFGDVAPVEQVNSLLADFDNLHVYWDDAHGFGWEGLHGRGYVLSNVDWHPRMVLAAGLSKSFGATGGVLAFGDPALRRRVLYTGGPLTFSGPVQPADLGAAVASADYHLSPAHRERQIAFHRQIRLARSLLNEYGLPIAAEDFTPIWFIVVGQLERVLDITRAVMDDGYYVNPSSYPAVPMGSAGIRFTQTLHQTDDHLEGLIDSLLRHITETGGDISIDLRQQTSSSDTNSQLERV